MQYMFLIYSQETAEGPSPEETESLKNRHWALMRDAEQEGVLVAVERLKPVSTATTVRMKQGRPVTIDGPFAETKEQLAGYYILDCKNLDEAIDWARRIPTTCSGSAGCIEIRPVADLPRQA